MAVVSEGQYASPATLAGHHVCEIIRHHQVANAEQFDDPLARWSCELGMIVEQLPGQRCILGVFQIAASVALGDQFRAASAQFANEIFRFYAERICGW